MSTTTRGDIKLISKDGNFGSGHLDWDIDAAGNVVILKDPTDYSLQAVLKAILSKVNSSGYGVDIGSFLGTKHIVPARAGIAVRLFRCTQLLSTWYQRVVSVTKLQMNLGNSLDTYQLQVSVENKEGEMLLK